MVDKKKENARNGGHPSLVRSGMPKQRNPLRAGEMPGLVRRRESVPPPRTKTPTRGKK